MLNTSCCKLIELGKTAETSGITASGGEKITKAYMDTAFDKAMEMIDAFERAFHMFYVRTEDVYNLALDEQFGKLRQMAINENNSSIPTLKKENIPWRLGFEPEAKKELKRVDELWKDVRKRLIENGSYCILRDFQLTDN